MKSMGHEVVSCGNGLEKFGLVDYQQGLWESKIIDGESLFTFFLSPLINPNTTALIDITVLDECIGEAK